MQQPGKLAAPTPVLAWFHEWYTGQCDGVWEHEAGLRFEYVQATARRAPGLRVTVELGRARTSYRTSLRARTRAIYSVDGAWMVCTLTPERFQGAADGDRLEDILEVLRTWLAAAEWDSAPMRLADSVV
jgi:hypothetical protein